MAETKITDRDYLYLSAVLKSREAKMLTRDKLERVLYAGSFADAAKLLQEDGWPEMAGENAKGVDAALSQMRQELFAEVENSLAEKEVAEIFRAKYDYHNAKALIKGEGAGVAVEHILSRAGRIPPAKLTAAFAEDDYREIPEKLGAAMAEAKGTLARTENPQLADFILDKAYYAELLELAGGIESSFPTEYVRSMIDGANLRSMVRCSRMKKDETFMRLALIPGGTVDLDDAVRGEFSQDELAGLFDSTPFRHAAELGAAVMEGGGMTAFERECDNALNAALEKARRTGFGSEVAFGYLAAEENYITAVRMVLTGLLSGIDPERLKERLRDTYV